MSQQTIRISNPNGNAKALRITDAAGTFAAVYVSVGMANDVTLNNAGGNYLVVALVEPSIVPAGAGGHGEE